ncbi:hypothetical protein Tco_0818852 [Tanacetum coccineum]
MPMSSDTKLTKDEKSESVDNIKYRGMIDDPKTSHLEEVKRIFRYIKGTTHLGLWYPKGPVVYVESDHAGYYVDRKSTSSICTFMGCFLTSWFIKKQTALAISTTEAEYVSAEKAGQSVFTTEWSLEALATYQEPSGPYHTKLPTPDVSHQYLQFERIEPSRVIKGERVELTSNHVLTKKIESRVLLLSPKNAKFVKLSALKRGVIPLLPPSPFITDLFLINLVITIGFKRKALLEIAHY